MGIFIVSHFENLDLLKFISYIYFSFTAEFFGDLIDLLIFEKINASVAYKLVIFKLSLFFIM